LNPEERLPAEESKQTSERCEGIQAITRKEGERQAKGARKRTSVSSDDVFSPAVRAFLCSLCSLLFPVSLSFSNDHFQRGKERKEKDMNE